MFTAKGLENGITPIKLNKNKTWSFQHTAEKALSQTSRQ